MASSLRLGLGHCRASVSPTGCARFLLPTFGKAALSSIDVLAVGDWPTSKPSS